jgi:hypothetical protein
MARDLNFRITADASDAKAELRQTEQAIVDTTKTAQGSAKTFQNLGKAIAAAFSFEAFGRVASQAMGFASTIQDTSDKLGVSAEAIQRWKFAAEQTGGTLEGLTSAATMLYRNLAGGEKGVVAALDQLGLQLEDVRAMKPEKAFELIADRIGQIPDPMKQVGLGAALMGRGFADNLPAMKQGLVALGDQAQQLGLIMSTELIAKGDELGDQWEQMTQRMQKLKAEALLPVLDVFTSLPKPLQTIIGLAVEFRELLYALGLAIIAAGGPVAAFTAVAGAIGSIGAALGTAGAAVAAFLSGPIGWIVIGVAAAAAAIYVYWDDITAAFQEAYEDIVAIVKALWEGVNYFLTHKFSETVSAVKGLVGVVDSVFKQMWTNVVRRSYVPDMIDGIAAEFARLPRVMVQPAVTGTKQVDRAFQDLAQNATQSTKQMIAGGLQDATRAFTQFGLAGSRASSAVSAGIQQMIQGIQQLAAATNAMQAFGGWMSIFSAAYSLAVEAMSRDTRQAAVDAQHWADALRDVGAAIEELGASAPSIEELVAAGFGAGGWAGPLAKFSSGNFSRDQLMQFMQFYQRLAEEGSFPWEKMEEAAKKYGIALDQLGPKFSQAKFIAPLREMVSEWRLLVENGANAEAVALGMKDKLIAATQEAIKFGFALPNGLKPALRILFDMGLLLDENGEQLRDFSQLEFAPTIEDSLKDLVEIFKDLVDVLSAQLPRAAARAEDALGRLAPPRLWPGPGAGDGGTGGRVPDSNLAPETAAYATVGAASIVINNPQFNDRASINHLTARIEQTMMSRMTQRGTRFVR